jgi:hypothetical protein
LPIRQAESEGSVTLVATRFEPYYGQVDPSRDPKVRTFESFRDDHWRIGFLGSNDAMVCDNRELYFLNRSDCEIACAAFDKFTNDEIDAMSDDELMRVACENLMW